METEVKVESLPEMSRSNGHLNARVLMYGSRFTKINDGDRKKFSYKTLFETADMCTSMGQTQSLEKTYKLMMEISKDETIPKDQKFAILFGEIEIMLTETNTYFFKNYDKKGATVDYRSIGIEDMRRRYLVEADKI